MEKKEVKVLVHASGRHVHLSEADLKTLFGPEAEIRPKRVLGADGKGDFLSDLKVEVVGPEGKSFSC